MNTGIFIKWENGGINSTAIKAFKEKNIKWEYSHLQRLTADIFDLGIFFPIGYRYVDNDIYEITVED